jgi:hypothetical protein
MRAWAQRLPAWFAYVIFKLVHRLRGMDVARTGALWVVHRFDDDEATRDFHYDLLRRLQSVGPLDCAGILVFGPLRPWALFRRRIIRADLQKEHTLVKPGGRGSEGAPTGRIPLPGAGGGHYLVRVVDQAALLKQDVVFEYSLPNWLNLRAAGFCQPLLEKLQHVYPLVYPPLREYTHVGRDLSVITLFADLSQPRRAKLAEKLTACEVGYRNIQGVYRGVEAIYRRTRILVNIRQTDHHDTLEELRVLPALSCGVIVINEIAPLVEKLPYARFMLWAKLEDIPALVQAVHADYERYFSRIFTPFFSRRLARIDQRNQALMRVFARKLGDRIQASGESSCRS